MNRPYRFTLTFLLLAPVLAGLGSCGESDVEHVTDPFAAELMEPEGADEGGVSGTVLNVACEALPYARIMVGTETGFTDASGRFFVPGVALESEVVQFDKDTRTTTNVRPLWVVPGGEVHFPDVMLRPLLHCGTFNDGVGGPVSVGSFGSGATFADSSFVDGGELFLGRTGAFMNVSVVGDDGFASSFPGEFRGDSEDGTEVAFDALGVVWTSMIAAGGQLGLAPGKSVIYRLGIDLDGGASAPAAITVWSMDLSIGRWREVGESTLIDGVYTVEVASLAPVCWALPAADPCMVSGVVHDHEGRPLANARVLCRGTEGGYRQAALTLEDGTFTVVSSRAEGARIIPYFGSVAGDAVEIDADVACPYVIGEPLTITLPDFRIDLTWNQGFGDLDAHLMVAGEWEVNYLDRGSLDRAPFAWLEADARDGGDPETIVGRRWYDGATEYWVRDHDHRDTGTLLGSGALVDLVVNGDGWSFAVEDAEFDEATSDTSGWWHVFDILVDGTGVEVQPVQLFEPRPTLD